MVTHEEKYIKRNTKAEINIITSSLFIVFLLVEKDIPFNKSVNFVQYIIRNKGYTTFIIWKPYINTQWMFEHITEIVRNSSGLEYSIIL